MRFLWLLASMLAGVFAAASASSTRPSPVRVGGRLAERLPGVELFVTWWFHDKGPTALQTAMVDGHAIAFATGIQSFTTTLPRQRQSRPRWVSMT